MPDPSDMPPREPTIAGVPSVIDAAPAGSELRGARLSCGYTMDDVQEQLGIRAEYIDAIERGALSELPSKAFHIGYVRSYAEFVDTQKFFGRNSDWYVEQLCGANYVEEEAAQPAPKPSPVAERRAKTGVVTPPVEDPRFTSTLRRVLMGAVVLAMVGLLGGGVVLFQVVQRVEVVEARGVAEFQVSR